MNTVSVVSPRQEETFIMKSPRPWSYLLILLLAMFSATVLAQSAPTISSVSPGSAGVSAPILITGTNFGTTQGSSTVTFNSTVALPTFWSTTAIRVPVPSGATTGNVVVTVGGLASSGSPFTISTAGPVIASVSPTTGTIGTAVTLTGTGFGSTQGASIVTFNGKLSTSVIWGSDGTSIQATDPTGATDGNIVVTVNGISSNGIWFPAPNITSVSPTTGAPGTSVTIQGTNFRSTPGTVFFNGAPATVSGTWSNTLTVKVPSAAADGNVVVETFNGVLSNEVNFIVPGTGPTITNLSPTSGSVGTGVTITGTNFGSAQGSSTVTFNGTLATPTLWNSDGTSIQVPVPNGATTGNVVVTVDGVASAGSFFTVTSLENLYCMSNTDGSCFTGSLTDGPASLPTAGIYTGEDGTPAPGTKVLVNCAANPCTSSIQQVLSNAVCGEIIVIPATVGGTQTVSAPITLPAKSCDSAHWIWIESDQISNPNFPAEHVRATPCAINQPSLAGYPAYSCSSPAYLMPLFQDTQGGISGEPIQVAAGANYYRLIGLEVGAAHGIVQDGSLVDLSNGADHIIIDRSIIHGEAQQCAQSGGTYTCTSADVKNGIELDNSTNVAVINSWIYDLLCPQGSCSDSHGIGGGNGTAAEHSYKIYNNFIAAAGEDFLQGGGGSGATTTTPTDIEIRSNHLFKNPAWMLCTACGGAHPEFKNNGEIKNAQRVLVEGNVCENSWEGWQTDQSGYCLLITPKNQSNFGSVTATSDSTGTILTGSFPSAVTSLNCANPGHCKITFNQIATFAQSWSSSSVTVSPAVTPNFTGLAKSCTVGGNPNAIVTDVIYRFNELLNVTNGIQFAPVPSDCGDLSLGMHNATIHDNLFEGVNSNLANNQNGNSKAACFQTTNGQLAPANVHDYKFAHNTCAIAASGKFGFSGLDVTLDMTDTTIDGSTGSYFANRDIENNIGPAGGQVTYKAGAIYPHGLNAGLAQQSCTPPVTGATCTWTYQSNVLGLSQWANQTNNTPFPSTNQTCGSSACFPVGNAFTSQFVSYDGPNGQPGYLGNYQLLSTSPYKAAGTDGKDIGISDWTKWSLLIADAHWLATNYTAASITTTSLPNATTGVAYTNSLSATSASDFQWWTVVSGPLPPGLSLSSTAVPGSWAITGTPTTSGNYTFTLQMMDAAQQYATQIYIIQVN